MPTIRPYRQDDRAAVYDICIRTAHLGSDAAPLYRDPVVLPEIFAGPYVYFEPSLAFVVADDDDRAVGYVLGTADTATFVKRFAAEWLPLVADRFPRSFAEPASPDEIMVRLLHTPERMLVPALADYPAHLHIDLLPAYQRAGHGRALIEAFVGELRAAGVPAVHLGMATENRPARLFYDRVGFHVIDVPDAGDAAELTYLGMRV
jgi:ribosomal protein S18 acetylase RimI-like enzyme